MQYPGHTKKNCFKYKRILKKKDGSGANGARTSGKQWNKVGVAKEEVEESCDVLPVNLGRGKERFSDD